MNVHLDDAGSGIAYTRPANESGNGVRAGLEGYAPEAPATRYESHGSLLVRVAPFPLGLQNMPVAATGHRQGYRFCRGQTGDASLISLADVLIPHPYYQVFLFSRIREQCDKTGDNSESAVYGVTSTAGLSTGAALIMVAVSSATMQIC